MDRLARLAWPFDGFFPIDRLRAWAMHGVLEREALADENPWTQDRFRATDRTRALLGHGLGGVGDAPQLYVGGCLVNDPTSPWVRTEEDSGWRLALHKVDPAVFAAFKGGEAPARRRTVPRAARAR